MRRSLPSSLALALTLTATTSASATEFFVDGAKGNDNNPGSSASPFATIGHGLALAQPGDTVTVRAGTYAGLVSTVRAGTAAMPITVRAEQSRKAVLQASGKVLSASHAYHVFEGLVIDGLLGAGRPVTIATPATGLVLRDVEVMNGGNNCIDMDSPDGVLIEKAAIHHCLLWDPSKVPPGPVDAHGITGTGPLNLTVRDSEIYYVSGDAIQLSPPRAFWDNIVVERTTMWTGPLPAAAGMFPAGTVVGENAFDSKTPVGGPRPRITFRSVVARGYKGFITNQAAFNLKENVEAVLDGVTVHGAEIGFRLRGPAKVTIRNAVTYGNDKTARYEDGIADLRIVNVTFADTLPFMDGGGGGLGAGFTLKNALFLGTVLPKEAMGSASNMLADASVFVNAAMNDYHLAPKSMPVDKGEALSDVTADRDGTPRPFGPAHDIGAYEWTDMPVGMDGGPSGSGAGGASSGAAGAGGGGGSKGPGEEGGCGCSFIGGQHAAFGANLAWLVGVAALMRRLSCSSSGSRRAAAPRPAPRSSSRTRA